jgi:hypothetical protein
MAAAVEAKSARRRVRHYRDDPHDRRHRSVAAAGAWAEKFKLEQTEGGTVGTQVLNLLRRSYVLAWL